MDDPSGSPDRGFAFPRPAAPGRAERSVATARTCAATARRRAPETERREVTDTLAALGRAVRRWPGSRTTTSAECQSIFESISGRR
jgi:hypothetical protein